MTIARNYGLHDFFRHVRDLRAPLIVSMLCAIVFLIPPQTIESRSVDCPNSGIWVWPTIRTEA